MNSSLMVARQSWKREWASQLTEGRSPVPVNNLTEDVANP